MALSLTQPFWIFFARLIFRYLYGRLILANERGSLIWHLIATFSYFQSPTAKLGNVL
jgi:hypothetical protein